MSLTTKDLLKCLVEGILLALIFIGMLYLPLILDFK